MLRTLIPAIQHIFRSVDLNKKVEPPPTKKKTATVAPSQIQIAEKQPQQK